MVHIFRTIRSNELSRTGVSFRSSALVPVKEHLKEDPDWLPTKEASRVLGWSAETLKRCRDSEPGGFLIAGKDYLLGPLKNSTIVWYLPSIRQKFHQRGRQLLRERQLLKRQGQQQKEALA